MNCLSCRKKSCRVTQSCGGEKFSIKEILEHYENSHNQKIVQAAARLVDGGRAGTLSRIEELLEFIKDQEYNKVGLAYCYGMENIAEDIMTLFKSEGIRVTGVSCTVGGISQQEINQTSDLPGVSCNPLFQGAQLEAEGVDLAVTIGLCLGHDILFNRTWTRDVTTLVVKDRRSNHAPLEGISRMKKA